MTVLLSSSAPATVRSTVNRAPASAVTALCTVVRFRSTTTLTGRTCTDSVTPTGAPPAYRSSVMSTAPSFSYEQLNGGSLTL